MKPNNTFTFKRLELLFRQYFIVNKKLIGISVGGLIGTLFVALYFLQAISNFRNWDNHNSMNLFNVIFILLAMIYSGLSFPALRSKEKSIAYLLLPASTLEKFVFEFLTRIVLFILLIPVIFWSVANLEGTIVHHFVPRLTDYKFSFGTGIAEIMKKWDFDIWGIYAFVQFFLFILISSFTGASHFTKSPLVKTLFSISGIICGYLLLLFLLIKGLNLKNYDTPNGGVLIPKNNEELFVTMALGATVVNLFLLATAWFRIKEKEA